MSNWLHMKGKVNRFYRVIQWFAIGVLAAGIVAGWAVPAIAQIGPLPQLDDFNRVTQTRIKAKPCGNLFCATVTLDNRDLFEIATSPTIEADRSQSFAVKRRVEYIETILMSIVASVDDPETLQIQVGTRNNETVVYAPEQPQLQDQIIVTVTQFDSLYHGKPKKALGKEWRDIIREQLRRSIAERQTFQEYFWNRKLPFTLLFLVLMAGSSWLLLRAQKLIRREAELVQSRLISDSGPAEPPAEPTPESGSEWGFSHLWERLPRIGPAQQKQIVQFLRQVAQWGQIFIWLGGFAYLLYYYPETRAVGVALGEVPLALLVYYLIVVAAIKISHFAIEYYLQDWVEQSTLRYPNSRQRFLSRQTTYTAALKGLASFISYFIGFILTLNTLLSSIFNTPLTEILTGVGVIGFALTYVFQSAIKDVLNGCLILWSDQYAVGDVIGVGDKVGLVEYMSLYITQIRSPDGNLITIPNGSISIVENLTKNWSRVNFTIEVAYDSDIRKAMQIIKDVGDKMFREPPWHHLILESPQVLGVDAVSHAGMLVRVWITTQPIKHWEVGREFRCRVKEAFDRENIRIGIPQQAIWHQSYHHLLDGNGHAGGEFSASH